MIRLGRDLPGKIPEQNSLIIRDVEAFAVDAFCRRWGWFAIGRQQTPCGEDVRLRDIADIREVVDVPPVTHLEAGFPLLGDRDHLAEADGVGFADRNSGPQRAGQHRRIAMGAVGGEDGFFRRGFGQSVDAFLGRRLEDGLGFVRVEEIAHVVVDDGGGGG
jgi:hypothetical protein